MSFEIPEPGSPAMVDLLCRLEEARAENAKAWIVVVIDDESGEVAHGCGPFTEPEQALVEAGRQEADWNEHSDPEDGTWTYAIVPLWGPGE